MCQGFPAPRCSRHAWNALTDAQAGLENAKTFAEIEIAERKVRKAEKAYFMTPAGFQYLEEKIKKEKNTLVKDKLYNQLFEGRKARRDNIILARRIARENRTRLEHVKNMRLLSIPLWSIAGQLNVEFLENKGLTVDKVVDVKNQCFVLNVTDSKGKTEKVLSIPSKYYVNLGFIGKSGESFDKEHTLGSILNGFISRGSNVPISFDELGVKSQETVLIYIVQAVKNEGFSKIIFCNPSVAYSEIINVDDLGEFFNITLLTPKNKKTGSDNIPARDMPEFVSKFNGSIVGEPVKVGEKTVIELEEQILNPDELYVGGKFYLSHLKDNFYMVKKLGKVNKHIIRAVISL